MGKKKQSQLGKGLLKCRKTKTNDGFISSHHTTNLSDGCDWGRLNLQSLTEESALDDFLHTAELAGTDFTAERLNVRFVKPSSKIGVISASDQEKIENVQKENMDLLSIPRRPKWDESTTGEELQQQETQSFLEWRRKLAELEQLDHITMTPFEKNLEFWRQLWRVIERSDIVVQIVDSRNPLLFRCSDLDEYVKEVSSDKVNLILMNKADLLSSDQRKSWHTYFNSIGIKAIFFSALEELNKDEEETSEEISVAENFRSLSVSGADHSLVDKNELIEIFKRIPLTNRCKENITTVGLVGYPNVGKSSTINAIFKMKKVSVSATPGKTKHFQTLFVDDSLCLCDCPGLVMPTFVSSKAEMILNGILPIDQMRDHLPPMNLLCQTIPKHILENTYSMLLPSPQEGEDPDRAPYADEVLNTYGYLRGFMTQRGLPDTSRAARLLLKDYVNGKLLYCVAPPNVSQNEFHVFPMDTAKSKTNIAPIMAVKAEKRIGDSVDREFLEELHSTSHSKGQNKIPGFGKAAKFTQDGTSTDNPSTSSASLNGKPWKKHNNRKKKDKLRKVYSYLDK